MHINFHEPNKEAANETQQDRQHKKERHLVVQSYVLVVLEEVARICVEQLDLVGHLDESEQYCCYEGRVQRLPQIVDVVDVRRELYREENAADRRTECGCNSHGYR